MSNDYKKYDNGKLRYDLIPPSTLRGLAEVLTFGANKYGPDNWRDMPETELYRTVGAIMRHFEEYRQGYKHDKESGMPHLWHVLANVAFLIEKDYSSTYKVEVING